MTSDEIYCRGPLLHAVQMSGLFPDSKTFVDKKLKFSPDIIQNKFSELFKMTKGSPTKDQIRVFVEENFDPEDSEFELWEPTDWHDNPDFLSHISDPLIRGWTQELHGFWKKLGRKVKADVQNNPELYSLIYVPNPIIIPGGRFRELYYWDSYWIVQGLLLSGMKKTVRGMLENFFLLVKKYGLIPNGGRTYYINRSQPPMLIPMMKSYLDSTQDLDFLRNNITLLEKEFRFWMKNRTVTVHVDGEAHRMARYIVDESGPRPESYREDVESASALSTAAQRDEFYKNIKAGAESGWDFSTRWFSTSDTSHGDLSHIRTSDIVPVDLNSFLYLNACYLSEFCRTLGMEDKAEYYSHVATQWRQAVNKVLWDENKGVWFDYDLRHQRRRDYFYLSNVTPLWAGCYEASKRITISRRVVNYLRRNPCLDYPYGVPTSTYPSGQQWDFPNAWAPLQHILVRGLDATGVPEAQQLAFQLAKKWVLSNFTAYYETHPEAMFEKYDVRLGRPGYGGEYHVQTGFGWTNGVIMDLLHRYGNKIFVVAEKNDSQYATINNMAIASLAALRNIFKRKLHTKEGNDKPTLSEMLHEAKILEILLSAGNMSINEACPVS